IPINLVWILTITSIHVLHDHGWVWWRSIAVPAAAVLLIVVVPGLMIWEGARARRLADRLADEEDAAEQPLTFPVPPLDLTVPTPPRMLTRVGPAGEVEGRSPEGETDG